MVFNALQQPIEKTHQVIWDTLHVYGRIEWQQTLLDFKKVLYIAYQDVLNEFDSMWGVKGLIVTCSNLVVMWKVRPWMDIISQFPLGFALVLQRWLYLVPFLQLIFNLCP